MAAPKGNKNTLGKHWKVKDTSKISKSHLGLNTWSIGRKISEEHKKKIKENNCKYWLGKKRSEETIKKMKIAMIGKYDNENHPQWIKDRNKIKIGERNLNDPLQKEWRRAVKNRDGWKCKINNKDCKGRLEAHHILDWKNYPELRYEVNNGITLCQHHHPRKKEEVAKLSPYFQNLVASLD
jgi:hypothetical protein